MSKVDDQRALVLEYVETHPGATTGSVRRALSARHETVSELLEALEERGAIENRGNGHAHAWHPLPTGSDNGSGPGGWKTPAQLPSFPRALAGVRVVGWSPPTETAEALSISTRQLLRLEGKGLPAHGSGHEKRHPWPHVLVWFVEYQVQKQRMGGSVKAVDLEVALIRDRLFQLEEFGDHGQELVTDAENPSSR